MINSKIITSAYIVAQHSQRWEATSNEKRGDQTTKNMYETASFWIDR